MNEHDQNKLYVSPSLLRVRHHVSLGDQKLSTNMMLAVYESLEELRNDHGEDAPYLVFQKGDCPCEACQEIEAALRKKKYPSPDLN